MITRNAITQNPNNKWEFTLSDAERDLVFNIEPRKSGFDFIDRNFKYHSNYNGCVSRGILIKIEDSFPRAIVIKSGFTRIWHPVLNERFKKHSKYIKSPRNKNGERSRSVCELA